MSKVYKNIDELIIYLREDKKIIVKDEFRHYFEERSYASIINPYKEFFSFGRDENGRHIYLNDVDFADILNIMNIDDMFSIKMFSLIGEFEKKFKNTMFDQICSMYINCDKDKVDYYCTTYLDEIKLYFENGKSKEYLPRFCVNLPYYLNGYRYVDDDYNIESKEDLLLRILKLGCNEKCIINGKRRNLIDHYKLSQKKVPLWIIQNALTFGELNIIFAMLDSNTQKNIISKICNESNINKITLKKILKFSGILEKIRQIRNVVNHYEPLFPFIMSNFTSIKTFKESQFYISYKLLSSSKSKRIFNIDKVKMNINENNYNIKHFRVLEFMIESIKK